MKAFNCYTPDDFVETLRSATSNPTVTSIMRPYFFEENDLRSVDDVDFSSLDDLSFIHSWEKGVATYIQRLNELYLNSTILSMEDLRFARVLAGIAYFEYCRLTNKVFVVEHLDRLLNNQVNWTLEDRYFRCIQFMVILCNDAADDFRWNLTT
jgi:hypothetical protein